MQPKCQKERFQSVQGIFDANYSIAGSSSGREYGRHRNQSDGFATDIRHWRGLATTVVAGGWWCSISVPACTTETTFRNTKMSAQHAFGRVVAPLIAEHLEAVLQSVRNSFDSAARLLA